MPFFYCFEIYCSQNDYQNEQDDCIFLLDVGLHVIMILLKKIFGGTLLIRFGFRHRENLSGQLEPTDGDDGM